MSPGRVLMIAHHFPPAGGSGSNRALAFARYLAEYGWQVTVLTPGVEWAANRDDRLLADVPRGPRVVRTRSLEAQPRVGRLGPAGEASRLRTSVLRSHVGHLKRFPDAHIGWLPFALAAARQQHYDLVYSSSGPFTSHVVGLLLVRATGKPWVAELRDGWHRWNRAIFPDYPAWRDALERRLEAAAVRAANRVVVVTERMACAFRDQYAELPAAHFTVVPNGYDPPLFDVAPSARSHEAWELVQAGALYDGRIVAAFMDSVR